ncbi:MAG: response regulator transcription factor [Deltaproteobacteria bacterium]|nr:response regulator transcription factor [Deltaproteobacteria bacterium]
MKAAFNGEVTMKLSGPTRVVLADDNQLMRMGLRMLFTGEPDIQLVGEAQNGVEALKLCQSHKPDVLIADLRMPLLDGISVTQNLTAAGSSTRVLVLSHYDGDEKIFQALRAGAMGYITKDTAPGQILDALRSVSRGERHIPNKVAAKLAERLQFESLTMRERQVMSQVALGLSNKAVGKALGIAERTVATHMQALLGKLGASSRTEAVSLARARGLIDPE